MRALIVSLLLVGCKTTPPPPPAPSLEAGFWKWFAAHAAEVGKIERGDEPIADQLAAELHKVNDKLTFEMGIKSTPKELIISADGLQAAFPAVKKLVAAAPPLDGWKVIAFRPRKAITELEIGAPGGGEHRKIKLSDLRFRTLAPPGDKIDVALYLPSPADKPLQSGTFILLDALLGEYDVETRLGEIQMLDGKDAPRDARPLSELQALVDKG